MVWSLCLAFLRRAVRDSRPTVLSAPAPCLEAHVRKTIRPFLLGKIRQGSGLRRVGGFAFRKRGIRVRDPKKGGARAGRTFEPACLAVTTRKLLPRVQDPSPPTKPDCWICFAAWEPRIWAYMLTVRSLSCFRSAPGCKYRKSLLPRHNPATTKTLVGSGPDFSLREFLTS